jgi:outer membrane protein OmpA-like peptidoglycan-associated protein
MTTRIACVFLLAVVVASVGLAQTAGSEKPTLLQDKGLQLGVQIGGLIGDNEQPKEMKIIRLDNLTVQLFETFSPRVFLDHGLMNHVRGQVGASYGKIVGRYYSTSLLPIDYRFMVIPWYVKCFSPYAYLGVGGLHYDVTVGASRKSAGVETTGWVAYMPGGLGFVCQCSDHLAFDFNVGYNFIFDDDVNGHRAGTNDSYYSGHFGIRLPLASKTAAERQEEELQKRLAAEEQQRKTAEMKAAEDQRQKELEAKKAAEEKRLKEQEAQKALEAQKAIEAQKALEAQQAQEVRKPAEPVAPKPEPVKEAKKEIAFEPVYFETNSSKLALSERAKLNAAAKTLQQNPDVKVDVSGHTDSTGPRLLNERLSVDRANAVRQYLIGKGISGERLTTKGYAFDRPAAPNETAEGRRLNRRAAVLEVVK